MGDLKEALAQAGIDVSRFAWFRTQPDPIASLEVEGAGAVSLWRQLRVLTASTGHYPLLVGDRETVASHHQAIESAPESTAAHSGPRAVAVTITADVDVTPRMLTAPGDAGPVVNVMLGSSPAATCGVNPSKLPCSAK